MTVLVVGALHLDVVLNAPNLPAIDETVTGSSVDYVFGGKGGNQAVSAAQMGASVHFAGRTGSDQFAGLLRAALDSNRIDKSQLQRDPGPSGMSAAIVDAQGDYGAVIVSAANLNIDGDQIKIPDGTTLVLLQNEIPEAVNLSVAKRAKAAGAQVWWNAAPARSTSVEFSALVDLVIVNRVEAGFYQGKLAGCDVLTTLGPDGVMYQDRSFAALQVAVTSTHGAGDMFVGALAASVAQGTQMAAAIAFAQAAAALHVSRDHAAAVDIDAAAVAAFQSSR
ncbi:MAG: PfkB family carbohydrate kinase [Pseudomonadota bacterium]